MTLTIGPIIIGLIVFVVGVAIFAPMGALWVAFYGTSAGFSQRRSAHVGTALGVLLAALCGASAALIQTP